MNFVIVGGGRVGLRTARVVAEEGHAVTVIEHDRSNVEQWGGNDFEIIEGDGAREEDLQRAGLEEADAIGALARDITVNFVACMIAKNHGCRTVMRADSDYHEEIYRRYANQVDEVVYPERLGAIVAKNALLGGNIRAIADIAQNLQIVELTVTDESPTRGYTLSEIELPANARVLAFGKQDGVYDLPDADDSLELGDRLIALADFSVLDDVRRIIVGDTATASTA